MPPKKKTVKSKTTKNNEDVTVAKVTSNGEATKNSSGFTESVTKGNKPENTEVVDATKERLQIVLHQVEKLYEETKEYTVISSNDFDTMRKNLFATKLLTQQAVYQLKVYFETCIESKQKDTFCDQALKILRKLVDVAEEEINQDLLLIVYDICSKSLLSCLCHSYQNTNSVKAIKILFHLLRHFYKKEHLSGVSTVTEDLLVLIDISVSNKICIVDEDKKLFLTAYQMCCSLYTRYLPKSIRNSQELTTLFQMRAVSLSILVNADWPMDKMMTLFYEFLNRWSKMIHQTVLPNTSIMIQYLLLFLRHVEQSLSTIQRVSVVWKLQFLCLKLMLVHDISTASKQLLKEKLNSHIHEANQLKIMNVFLEISVHIHKNDKCTFSSNAVQKQLNFLPNIFKSYLKTDQSDLALMLDVFELIKYASKRMNVTCRNMICQKMNILLYIINHKAKFSVNQPELMKLSKPVVSNLIHVTEEFTKHLDNDNVCEDCCKNQVSRIHVEEVYKSILEELQNSFIENMIPDDHETCKSLMNSLYRLSVMLHKQQNYSLALIGLELSIASERNASLYEHDLKASKIKEICAKYNLLIKCCMKKDNNELALEYSKKLLHIFKKCVDDGNVALMLEAQVQFHVKLKLKFSAESKETQKPLSCLFDDLSGTEEENSFWCTVLVYEHNAWKKLSSKTEVSSVLQRIIELRRDIYETDGDLLNYSLMMMELVVLPQNKFTYRKHWCNEAVSVLEEMHNELCDSGDQIEWLVRDVLAIGYYQLSLLQYEEKVTQSINGAEKSINEIVTSFIEEGCERKEHDEDYIETQFTPTLNMAIELWSEVIQEVIRNSSDKNVNGYFQDASLAAECLYNAAILYSLMSQNLKAIEASYLSGLICKMCSRGDETIYADKQMLSWVFAASQFLLLENIDQPESLIDKMKKLTISSTSTQHQLEILDVAYLISAGKVETAMVKLNTLLADPLMNQLTRSALSFKSDVYYLFSFIKLHPSVKKSGLSVEEDESYPSKSPFPSMSNCLKFLRGLYSSYTKGGTVTTFSSNWSVLDKLLHCLMYSAELLKQQGSVIEAKCQLKEALLLAKKHYLPFRILEIIQRIASIDLLLENETSFNDHFDATSTILNSSIGDCMQDDNIYLPEFVTHATECSCCYCQYPKLQEIHICYYLQFIESKRNFKKPLQDSCKSVDIVDALIDNAKHRFKYSLDQAMKFFLLEIENAEINSSQYPESHSEVKAKKGKTARTKKTRKSLKSPCSEQIYFSKYNVEAKIIHTRNEKGNGRTMQTVNMLISSLEKLTGVQKSKHDLNRIMAQLYCLRSLLHIGTDVLENNWSNRMVDVPICSNQNKVDSLKRGKTEELLSTVALKSSKKATKRGGGKGNLKKQDINDEMENLSVKSNGGNFDIQELMTDLHKALIVLNPYTDTLIIKAIYQLISSVTGLSNIHLTISTQLLSSARTLHQQIISSCGKKLMKMNSEKETNTVTGSLKTVCDLLQKYSEPEFIFGGEQIQNLVDNSIPKEWCICSISLAESKKSLLISRVQPFRHPIAININLKEGVDPASSKKGIACDLAAAFDEDLIEKFENILKENNESMKIKSKKTWWNERLRLNKRLQSTINKIENDWIRGWKGLLLGECMDSTEVQHWDGILSTICKQIEKKISITCDKQLLGVLLQGFSMCNNTEILDVITTLYGDQYADIMCQIINKNLNKLSKENPSKRHPIVLILDKHLQRLPWESISTLSNQSVTRMPSLLLTVTHCINNQDLIVNGVSTDNVFYLLNPRNDLKRTEDIFLEMFQRERWSGITGRIPTTEEYGNGLKNSDIFIYCGHGSGQEYLPWDSLQKLNCKAISLLMGCSSGKLVVSGNLEAYGMIHYYLLSGCPSIVANLWDVTDKDIDSFFELFLKVWITESSQKNISECVTEARTACKLEYLIGAAPVVYGLPLHVRKNKL